MLNLTQHQVSDEQASVGVFEPPADDKARIRDLLTFSDIPSAKEMQERAEALVLAASRIMLDDTAKAVMIGGAPFFMSVLERQLLKCGIAGYYAFSRRESVEQGGKKISVFKHLGFVPGQVRYREIRDGGCAAPRGQHENPLIEK